MSSPQAVGLVLLSGTWLLCAGWLLGTRARLSAVLLAGAALAVGASVWLRSSPGGAELALLLAGLLLAPSAVVTYPSATPTTVDRVAFAAVGLLAAVGLTAAVASSVSPYLAVGTLAVVVLHLWWRFEHLDAAGRRPLVWLVVGLGGAGVAVFAASFAAPAASGADAVAIVALGLPAVCMVVGQRRPDVVDATGVVVEAAVLGVTGLACVALYVVVSSLVTVATGEDPQVGIQALVAAAVATAFHPVRRRLHGMLDELLLGSRPDPIAAVAQVTGSSNGDTATVLARIREALVLPYVAIRSPGARGTAARLASGGGELVVSGDPTPHLRTFPLFHDDGPGAEVGARDVLVVGVRPGELQLSRADSEVLALVARLLGQTMRAQALSADLSESRAAIRGAVEEERRRLRRELHDGLGPTLTGIALTTDAVANLTPATDQRVHELLRSLRTEATAAIADVRRIVYGIRPPALDQLGLQGALVQAATALRRGDLHVVVEVGEDVGDLPAALEVAAYRIVTEALTNVARHATATRAVAEVSREAESLLLRVRDDGTEGVGGADWRAGVGLTSMRERAEELGGTLRAGATSAGGVVEARLPLVSPAGPSSPRRAGVPVRVVPSP